MTQKFLQKTINQSWIQTFPLKLCPKLYEKSTIPHLSHFLPAFIILILRHFQPHRPPLSFSHKNHDESKRMKSDQFFYQTLCLYWFDSWINKERAEYDTIEVIRFYERIIFKFNNIMTSYFWLSEKTTDNVLNLSSHLAL